ncbi:MAG: electron transfer flavoprotein subunit beta/FixA family protein [Ferrimicrobium sp.]
MNIAVCVKQIPDPAVPGVLDPTTFRLDRSAKLIMDDSDAYGVEIALRLAEASGGGEVILVSMAPNEEVGGLRTGLAMGAARAILVSDPALAGADALVTATVLAAAVKRSNATLVVAATESTDGYTGTVPAQIAAFLGWPALTFAKSVTVEGTSVRIDRQSEDGFDEVSCELPAVVSVTAGVVDPRYPSFMGIKGAKNKPVEIVSVADLGCTVSVGEAVISVVDAESRSRGVVVEDDGNVEAQIVSFLEQIKVV